MGEQQSAPHQTPDAGGAISLRPATMTLTIPAEDVRHTITDDQLEILCRGGKDYSFEWCLGLFGAGLGLAQNVLAVCVHVWNGKPPTSSDTLLALVCVGCLAAAVAKFTEHRSNKSDIDTLKDRILKGKKIVVK